MNNIIKIKFRKAKGDMKVLAFATVTYKGIKIPGFKIGKSMFNDNLIAYLPSKAIGNGKYKETIKLSDKDEKYVKDNIIKEYNKFKIAKKTEIKKVSIKKEYFISSIRLNLLFHFYRNHKTEITDIRIWFVARNVLDVKGAGSVDIKELAKLTKIKIPYLKMICRKSDLFSGVSKHRVYYKSQNKLMRLHRLYISKGKIRQEKITRKFSLLFKGKKAFEGYICKCFMENDLDKKYKYKVTRGRLSYDIISAYFKISRNTAISNIKISDSKYNKNIIHYHKYKFKNEKEFRYWLNLNSELVINGYRISDNFHSYRLKKIDENNYILTKQLPNIFQFTGFSIVNTRTFKGK